MGGLRATEFDTCRECDVMYITMFASEFDVDLLAICHVNVRVDQN